MLGKPKLDESRYLDELNATLDEISVKLNLPLPHFRNLRARPRAGFALPVDIAMPHLPYYLRAERIMQRHFEIAAESK